jgi:hypothetical protein
LDEVESVEKHQDADIRVKTHVPVLRNDLKSETLLKRSQNYVDEE